MRSRELDPGELAGTHKHYFPPPETGTPASEPAAGSTAVTGKTAHHAGPRHGMPSWPAAFE